jgi:hypothetical protein
MFRYFIQPSPYTLRQVVALGLSFLNGDTKGMRL